jgi:hypothetical protein
MIQINAACRYHSVGDVDVGNLWDHQMIELQSLFSAPAHTCCKIPHKREPQVTFNAKKVDYFIHTAPEEHKFCKYYLKIIQAKIFKYASSLSPQHAIIVFQFHVTFHF